tara:strand:+ start:813 stop:1556 length:744 start_codon:yes stop_codon:yes gene_type:complete
MKYLSLILVALISFVQPISAQSPVDSASIPMPIEQINSSMNMAQKRVREAAVKISTGLNGHGSGSYIVYKDVHLVFTAQHVTDGPVGSTYHVFKGNEVRIATLLWSDADADMAVLRLTKKFVTIEPMKWNPQKRLAEVGTTITYSGYPSDHKLMTFAGSVAGYADKHGVGKQVIVNTYGWFGCSGSVVYTMSGEIVGILYGVDVEYYPDIQVQENMIWVVPIQRLQMDVVLKQMCREFPNKNYRACR